MHWPPWKPDPHEVRARREAEQDLEETLAQWDEVLAAVQAIDSGLKRNGLIEKAFAIRERGDRR